MRSTYLIRGLSLACLGVMAVPSLARAELRVCQVTAFEAGRPTVECHSAEPCTSDPGCVAMDTFVDPQCTDLAGRRFCAPRCGTLFGCDGDGDCPVLRGVLGSCESTGLDEAFPALCRYRDDGAGLPQYCTGMGGGISMSIGACHRDSAGAFTANWYEGNCDGDGCLNGSDPDPCNFDPATSCAFRMDLGPVCDMPMPGEDAGVPSGDAGVPSEDDAGGLDEDAGGLDEDAGVIIAPDDAGSSEPMDATTAPPGTSFAGGGGCRCVASGRSADGAGALALMSLVGLALTRRRRRR